MGGYDQLCILCGIAPSGGPSQLFTDPCDEADSLAAQIASKIILADPSQDYSSIFQIAQDALLETDETEWVPKGIRDWSGFQTCVAVGYFDNEDGAACLFPDDQGRDSLFPDGSKVQLRHVSDGSAGGFTSILSDTADANGQFKKACLTHCTSRDPKNPNFFVSEACYHYLEAWITASALPPQCSDVPYTPGLNFAGELYEIVNSRTEVRERLKGLLPCINYSGIEETCEQYQEDFQPSSQGFQHIASGIEEGLTGEDLLPHLIQDFQCWMFMRPDIWPSPPDSGAGSELPDFTHYHLGMDSKDVLFDNMSADVLLTIARDLPLPSYFALSATCKSLRRRLTGPVFLDCVLKKMMALGPLRWIMPIGTIAGETDRAFSIAKEWLKPAISDDQGSDTGSNSTVAKDDYAERHLFHSTDFPALAFLHACFASDSMRNRQRLWGIAKQFEVLWRDFRLHGWEVDRFRHSY
ncbi:hypothetical protein BV22DRAFT_1012355 [Leucogyrophana mollusca]|uniref:Uncharacterized protein n=1 Tax=Leucogyrophana mollusca TaxID=85980 RepID=A0ACB8BGD7_9AGAM|nr:hypothetical protein BV22DRAFT_1012355 [Leucogyrophana mollusca]